MMAASYSYIHRLNLLFLISSQVLKILLFVKGILPEVAGRNRYAYF